MENKYIEKFHRKIQTKLFYLDLQSVIFKQIRGTSNFKLTYIYSAIKKFTTGELEELTIGDLFVIVDIRKVYDHHSQQYKTPNNRAKRLLLYRVLELNFKLSYYVVTSACQDHFNINNKATSQTYFTKGPFRTLTATIWKVNQMSSFTKRMTQSMAVQWPGISSSSTSMSTSSAPSEAENQDLTRISRIR